jgi:N-acetylglutamate synthase-like GNAT family acetyltransferase
MNLNIRFGTTDDYDYSISVDKYISKKLLKWKLENNEIIIAESTGIFVGYLRLEYLWSKIPYIGLILIKESHRKQGFGRQILIFLEQYLKSQGIDKLYSSSQINESEPQAWHRRMGFTESGIINGINEDGIGEVFFKKDIL